MSKFNHAYARELELLRQKKLAPEQSVIREYRRLRGFTQDYLAQRVGVSVHTIGRWERGEYKATTMLVVKCTEYVKQARYVLDKIDAADLTRQQAKTLRGLVKSGDIRGAYKGLQKLIRRRDREDEPTT